MKKIAIISICIFASLKFSAQVGIQTSNPQATFHIDGGKDNPSTSVPTIANQANDFVVTSSGSVGVGTISPDASAAVEINSTKGFLLPRVATPSNIVSPATGLTVFDTSKKCISQNIGIPTSPEWVCLSPYTARFFYMPSVPFDTSTISSTGLTKDLYNLYKAQFSNVASNARSTSAPATIPYFPNPSDLYYYVTGYDATVFRINSISDAGVLNYDVLSNATSASFINIVFVVK